MVDLIPLSKQEGFRLEFKARASLDTPEDIAREVVGMLNAGGGDVWIGLREEEGRAVAVDPIPEADRELRRLQDFLVDTIEPPPIEKEVELQRIDENGGSILRVSSTPQRERGPYAFLRKGGRHYVIRVGARLRPMSGQEIAERFVKRKPDAHARPDNLESVFADLNSRLEKLQKSEEEGLLWLSLKPTDSLELRLDRVEERDVLIDPALTGNRRAGHNFTAAYTIGGRMPIDKPGYLAVGKKDVFWLEVHRSGVIDFQLPLDILWKGDVERSLVPEKLLEYPVSVFRLAGALFRDLSFWRSPVPESTRIVAQLAILGLEGWSLPGAPGAERLSLLPRRAVFRDEDFVLERPAVFDLSEIKNEPDLCGFRLIEQVYEAFELGRADIPQEFDRKTGRLILPE